MARKTKKMTLAHIDVLSAAKIYAVTAVIIGFIVGLVMGLITIIGGLIFGSAIIAVGAGLFFIIGFPIIFGVSAFVFGAIGAWLYNVIADRIGGVKVEFV